MSEIDHPTLGTITINRRFSLSHDGWFWEVRAENPWPLVMPDGTPSRMDRQLYAHEYDRTNRRMEKNIRKVIRKWEKGYERAVKELAEAEA